MNTPVVIALLLVVPALHVQGGALQQTNPPTAPPPTAPPTSPPPRGTKSPDSDRFNPRGFFEFMKKQADEVLGYAKDLKDLGAILGAPQFDKAVFEKKLDDLEKAESTFDSTEDFLIKALSSLYKKAGGEGGPPPAMCGGFVEYLTSLHKENLPIDHEVAGGIIATDFGCLGDKIEEVFNRFEKAASGGLTPEEEVDLILRTVAKITSIHRATERFYDLLEEVYPEDEGDKKRQMKDELLKLLLKRVLDKEPANKRSFGAIRSLLGRQKTK